MKKHLSVLFLVLAVAAGGFAATASANHTWGSYHWARTSNPFTLKVGDNVTPVWDSHLTLAVTDWSVSTVLDTILVPGSTNPKNCKAVAGRVEVCNSKYGNNGWLGIASIWASGSHITQGIVKMNDTYFNTAKYNTPAWRNVVMCQEVGHTLGLDHQDEDFGNASLNTCMDYSNDPNPNQHPNAHDYEMLETIYAHFDSNTTVGQTAALNRQEIDHNNPSSWGKLVSQSKDGRAALYERDFGNGNKIFTHVFWAQ